MSVIGSNILAGASGQGGDYTIARSLRFRSSASAYLNRTPASASNQKTWTFSAWLKRGQLTSDQTIFQAGNTFIRFGNGSADTLWLNLRGASTNYFFQTAQVFRDSSSWYHLVIAVDTTQATSTNRVKIYVNGVQVTTFTTYADYPPQNTDTAINSAVAHNIGYFGGFGSYFDGYLAEVNFIDGQALTPSSFGQTSPTTGVWQPKKYAGTYGTNGFYLPFTDNSALTTSSNVGLGKDFSGNGNYWTTNNISITAGSTYDSMTDVPTLTSATASNYCVWNPLSSTNTYTLSAGNLNTPASDGKVTMATFGVSSGKWYWEITVNNDSSYCPYMGVFNLSSVTSNSVNVVGFSGIGSDLNKPYTASSGTGTSSYGFGTFGFALDLSAGTLAFYKNNSLVYTDTTIPTDGTTLFPRIGSTSGGFHSASANFGQRPFAYTPPTGFVALNTFNLPTPTIGATATTQAGDYFNAVTYTGNGTNNRAVTGVGFQPDFTWIKERSGTYSHILTDAVRGTDKILLSNSTIAEFTDTNYLKTFTSDGFTVGTDGAVNGSGATFVSWNWRASNATAVTNTAGSITSTVSANTSAGFSVVTYTGTGANATVGHGLGVAPKMIIAKRRDSSTDSNWQVWHSNLASANHFLQLNTTAAQANANSPWSTGAVNSTTFAVEGGNATNNLARLNATYVAYCFSEVAGYSKFGSYTGNGSADGVFIHLGFRPRYLLLKNTSISNTRWIVMDTARDTTNVAYQVLSPSNSGAEDTSTSYWLADFVSNGVKLRYGADSEFNNSGNTFIYMAFAENPFKYSLAR
jgi:hypothetical protein